MKKNIRTILNICGVIFILELLSIFGFLYPEIRQLVFLVLVAICLVASLYDLKYGLLALAAELVIGSYGYLFYFSFGAATVSIRIAFWLVIMSVWFAHALTKGLKNKDWSSWKIPSYFYILFLVLILGFLNGLRIGNDFNFIFFDFNSWLFLTLIFPLREVWARSRAEFMVVIPAALGWLAFKTYLLLFVFSHNMLNAMYLLYHWTRANVIGEITVIQGGFYRIFLQSHIYFLLGFFIIAVLFAAEKIDKKIFLKYLSLLTIFFSVVLLSFSRSFWAGAVVGLLSLGVYIFARYGIKKFFQVFGTLFLSVIFSVMLVAVIVKFPYPNPLGGFSTADLFASRFGQISGEAAASSRWNLLPELWAEIKDAPLLGKGWGAPVTYKTLDPRYLDAHNTDECTTYAFEWGWLDIWLKIGLIGAGVYVFFIFAITKPGWRHLAKADPWAIGLLLGVLVISAAHFFTPYLNHPLGMGYLLFVAAYFKNYS